MPVVEVPASEFWLYENKNAWEDVHKGLQDVAKGRFSKVSPDDLQDNQLFELFLTDNAREQLKKFKPEKGLQKRYKAVAKCISLLVQNPKHESLQTHEFTS